jgi:hypothetical protein
LSFDTGRAESVLLRIGVRRCVSPSTGRGCQSRDEAKLHRMTLVLVWARFAGFDVMIR